MKAIVTGGAGFLGSHVADVLLAAGHTVLVIDDLSGGMRENVPAGALFERRSILDDLDTTFRAFEPDAVYHLAAYAAEGLSHHIPVFNYQNNLLGTANVLSTAYRQGVRHFVFTSSIAVYGHATEQTALDERDDCAPVDPYGVAKLACENHIRAFKDYYGRPSFTIFRPHNIYGPRQNISDPYRNVVGIFMANALRGQPLPIFGDGSQTRSFSFVRGVAECIAAAPCVPNAVDETFNVGADQATSVMNLATRICDLLGTAQNLRFLPPRREVQHAHCTHHKAHAVFGKELTSDSGLDDGITAMARYVSARPVPPATECPSQIEIPDHLPVSWQARLGSAGR